jgi:hypothetical protein
MSSAVFMINMIWLNIYTFRKIKRFCTTKYMACISAICQLHVMRISSFLFVTGARYVVLSSTGSNFMVVYYAANLINVHRLNPHMMTLRQNLLVCIMQSRCVFHHYCHYVSRSVTQITSCITLWLPDMQLCFFLGCLAFWHIGI